MPNRNWMIYGANGYTGTLLAEEAVRRGHKPLLAGRSAEKLKPLAERLGLDWLAVSLDDTVALQEAVRGVDAVMHAAGPYIHTAAPMLDACLAGVTNYLDVTGEIAVFEDVFRRDQAAWDRGIALIPGVGFDVVPSDCLVNCVAAQVADPVELTLAVQARSSASRGTIKTALEGQVTGGKIRREGKLRPYPLGRGARSIRFQNGEYRAIPIPWGDLVTAYRSTGIPNITTYMTFPATLIRVMPFVAPLLQVLKIGPVKRLALWWVERNIGGPDLTTRANGRTYMWAEVRSKDGQTAQGWLEGPEGYTLTALAGVLAVERVLADRPKGAFTPVQAFGPEFVLDVPGVTISYTL